VAQKNRIKKTRNKPKNLNKVGSLFAAASAIPLLGLCSSVCAQNKPEPASIRFQYAYFKDWQAGSEDRMTVNAPMVLFNAPISEKTEVEVGFVFDSMSGASPLYHDTLTGASGKGVEDERYSADATLTQYFDGFNLSFGGVYSTENDYDSIGANLSSRFWSSDKNTVFLFGINGNDDKVTSDNNPLLDERRDSYGAVFGVTQVINKNSLVQSNFTFKNNDGYLEDPYKLGDNRPESRDGFAWLTRYVRYLESSASSLHLDYRFYLDSWDIYSHTVEMAWYKPFGENERWMFRPRIRYYSQEEAIFYNDLDPIDITDDRFYTADQRLSSFGSLGAGVKLIRDFDDGFSMSLSYDFVINDSSWTILSQGSPNIDNLYLSYFSFGLHKKF